MRRFSLHLNALRAFEAAARLSSFTRAAEELHVSHSTISHHIKGLEKALGANLFIRQNRRVVLTSAGEALFPVLRSSFDQISVSLETIRQTSTRRALKVTVTPSFANKWLVPHLRRFREAHPGIEVRIQSSLQLADFCRDGLDLGVRTGWGEWPGLRSELLMPIHMTPLCSPRLLAGSEPLSSPDQLNGFTLIHADVSPGIGIESEWHEWLAAVGATEVDCSHGLSFHDPGLALQAAIDGLGIAMGYVELAAIDIAEGRLVRPFAAEVRHPWSYYTVIPEDNVGDLPTGIFSDWLRAEVSRNQDSPAI
jgi:LysR family glycine cleavage system transcriptional activator